MLTNAHVSVHTHTLGLHKLGGVAAGQACNTSIQEAKAGDRLESQGMLVYTASSRPARTTQEDTVSKINKKVAKPPKTGKLNYGLTLIRL